MLIAHAPAGYLITRILSRTIFKKYVHPERTDRFYQVLMFTGIIGGIFPDFDFLYQFFFDSKVATHHSYITHIPVFWISIWCMFVLLGKIRNDIRISIVGTTLCASALFHLVCDTLTGVIYWFYPLSGRSVNILKVADIHVWWVNNYMYHWTFLIEIALVIAAMIVFLRIKETITDLFELFSKNHRLRFISFRVGICIFGMSIIVFVGACRFNIDNRLVNKMMQLKAAVVRMVIS
jgi:inner membrane protein